MTQMTRSGNAPIPGLTLRDFHKNLASRGRGVRPRRPTHARAQSRALLRSLSCFRSDRCTGTSLAQTRVVPTLFLHVPIAHAADLASAPSKGTVGSTMSTLSQRFSSALALAVLLGMIIVPIPAQAEILPFNGQQAYPVGANPKGVSVGDCDGDGVDDLITAAQNSNEVIILRNRGDGSLEFGGGKTNVSQPTGAACADFNGDGLIDISAVSRLGDITLYYQDQFGAYNAGGTRPAGCAVCARTGDAKLNASAQTA